MLLFLELREDCRPIIASDIANSLGLTGDYLKSILTSLSKAGLINSTRGRNGGYQLNPEAKRVDLMKILTITEGSIFISHCVMGFKVCGKDAFCPMHEKWLPVKDVIIRMFTQITLEAMANDVRTGKYALVELPETLIRHAQ